MSVNEKNALTVEHANVPSNYSKIPLNSILAGTTRFGEVSPHFCARVVAGDKHARFMSGTETRSLNLVSPVLQEIKMHKTYGQVPMPAILPLNWDKLYTQPNIGDDVVAEDVGTTYDGFFGSAKACFENWIDSIWLAYYDSDNGTFAFNKDSLRHIINCLNFGSTIFSSGSLCSQLGNNYWPLFTFEDTKGYDNFFDDFISAIRSSIEIDVGGDLEVSFDGGVNYYNVINSLSDSASVGHNGFNEVNISFRRFLEMAKDSDFVFKNDIAHDADPDVYGKYLNPSVRTWSILNRIGSVPELPLNLDVLAAYQLFVAEYMTNDKVDYIYSSELYRQVLRSAIKIFFDNNYTTKSAFDTFTWNGNSYMYDEFSAYFLKWMMTGFASQVTGIASSPVTDCTADFLAYWNMIFGIRNSLRYGDYFTGSKTRPLAPIDVTVPVVSNKVSMVDVARQKGYLRFAFAVARIGRKLSKYSEEIMHSAPPTDYHHAWYLAETVDTIGSVDTENTNVDPSKSNQSAQTTISNIHSQSNQYAFETDVDINSVLIGVTTYDINRLYDKGLSRFNWHFDRYDMFNPLLQFTGDQEVKSDEIDVSVGGQNFGYQNKYAEYKFPINRCFGGLSLDNVLPGWVMRVSDRFDASGNVGISPSFIRSYPFELDKFFLSLTGMSLGTYFHFIVKHSNAFEIDRPMVASPKIM